MSIYDYEMCTGLQFYIIFGKETLNECKDGIKNIFISNIKLFFSQATRGKY